jgi:protocatechuate 3,4-dioxygenase beta subunit
MIKLAFVLIYLIGFTSCNGQKPPAFQEEILSDDFDRTPPVFYKMPNHLLPQDTSAGWQQNGQKILLTGIVYERDGKTPAANVLLYYYHTDVHGVYATRAEEPLNMPKNKLGQTHGYLRGWVQTGVDGRYAIYTVLPGAYPSRNEPAHIHLSVKEADRKAFYYIDDFVFDDDPLLTSQRRNKLENRAGSGVIRFVEKDYLWVGGRNLIIGLNIPGYAKTP